MDSDAARSSLCNFWLLMICEVNQHSQRTGTGRELPFVIAEIPARFQGIFSRIDETSAKGRYRPKAASQHASMNIWDRRKADFQQLASHRQVRIIYALNDAGTDKLACSVVSVSPFMLKPPSVSKPVLPLSGQGLNMCKDSSQGTGVEHSQCRHLLVWMAI